MGSSPTFTTADYAVFAVMLVISAAIGLFYAYRGRRQNQHTLGYLLANRSMTMIPVAISLSMSFQSSLTFLAIPAEVYMYGTMILWVLVIYILIAIITSEIFLPTFYRLRISSTYEYLQIRFGKVARLSGTFVFVVASAFYCGIVVYGPSLAFQAVTGFQLWAAIVSTGLVCTLYTTVGGLKGVIWTDVFQGFVMIAGLLAFLIKGSADVGGYSKVWEIAERGKRIVFNRFDADVRVRNTFWSIVIGGTVRWSGMYGVSQSQVQRYLSCRTERQARLSIYLNVIGLILLFTMAVLAGLAMYAYYETCDPLKSGCVARPDQIMPYMMLDIFEEYPGLSGLILSAVYAGSLSSVSSAINAMATVTMEDVVKLALGNSLSENTYSWISKVLVMFFGLVSIGMAFLLSTARELLQAAFSFMGMLMGSLVGLFTLAIQFPFSNEIGGVSGLVSGIAMTIWYYVGSKSIKKSNKLLNKLPLRNDICVTSCRSMNSLVVFNHTTIATDTNVTDIHSSGFFPEVFTSTASDVTTYEMLGHSTTETEPTVYGDDVPFYNLSYHYISVIGLCGTLVVGIIISLATGGWSDRHDVDKRLLRPPFDHWIFRSCLPEKVRWFLRFGIDWEDNNKETNIRQESLENVKSQKSQHDSIGEKDKKLEGVNASSFQLDEEVSTSFK